MIAYLQYSDWVDVLAYLSPDQSSSAIEAVVCTGQTPLGVVKTTITTWQDLRTATQNDDIFANQGDAVVYLVDCGDLKISSLIETHIAGLDGVIYLYSSTQEKLLADAKKILKNLAIDYIELKVATVADKKNIGQEHCARLQLSIDPKTVETVATKAASLSHTIDVLDMIALSGYDSGAVLAQVFRHPTTPLYMLPFSLNDAPKSTKTWAQAVYAAEQVQLGLSLLMTKIAKSGTTTTHKKAISAVIHTDFLLKTQPIAAVTAFRLLLWHLKNMTRVEANLQR
jgi:signal recognition particle receptor subunit beta